MKLYNIIIYIYQSEKPLPKELKRVIYDIDEGRILTRSDDPKCPK